MKIFIFMGLVSLLFFSSCELIVNMESKSKSKCGNGIIEAGEVCDSTNFEGDSCQNQGFTGGVLTCTSNCTLIDDSQCTDECENVCNENETQCDSDFIQICQVQDNGCTVWVNDVDCNINSQTCTVVAGIVQCTDTCIDTCTKGETQCNGDNSNILQTCEINNDTGCTNWVDNTNCTDNNQVCTVDSNGNAQCSNECNNICNENETQCNGNIVQICTTQTNSCTNWSFSIDCNAIGQVCVVDAGLAQCANDCVDACTLASNQCNGNIIQTCTTQTNGCTDWSNTTDCSTSNQICSNASGTVQCTQIEGSCEAPINITLPYTIDGTDFTSDFYSNESFNGTGCSNANGVEAVFAVDLDSDETLIIEQNGSINTVIRVLDICDPSNAECLIDNTNENHIEFLALTTGTYYVIVEISSSNPPDKNYNLTMFTLEATETSCNDGLDNDADGNIDCDDSDCFGTTNCSTETSCNDGLDNDADEDIDCDDSDCSSAFECREKKGIYERFTFGHPNDLNGVRIVYIPDGNGDYTYTVSYDATYFVAPGSTGGTTFVNEDEKTYHISLPFGFNFYGVNYNELWVNTNGFMVFDSTPLFDFLYTEDISEFFSHPMIAVMWDDLDVINSGDLLYADNGIDGSSRSYWAFTYISQEYNQTNELHAQVVLFSDGEIRVDYVVSDIFDGIVGISFPGALGTVAPVDFSPYPIPNQIIFTEIMYNPATVDDAYGEYIELYNKTDQPISLVDCEFSDNSNSFTPGNIIIPAHSYAVFVKNTETSLNGGITNGQSLNNINLDNTGDVITLSCPNGIIDTVTFTNNVAEGYSLQLDIYSYNEVQNDDMTNWCQTPNTITYGFGDYGSPLEENFICGTVLLSEDFETDPSSSSTISAIGDWEWGSSTGSSSCPQGYSCFGTVLDDNYSNNTTYDNNYLQIGPIDLTGYNTSDDIFMEFYMWLYINITNYGDAARIEVSTNGTTFEVLTGIRPIYNYDSSGGGSNDVWIGNLSLWQHARASLSAYAGNTIYIRFVLKSDNSAESKGFYVDNVRIVAQ